MYDTCSCSVSDAYCCCFSYHTLFDLQYRHQVEITTAAKRLGAEEGISVSEAERRLDANLFWDEIPRWEPSRPHHPYLYQRMFAHTDAAWQKGYDHGVCQGHWQPLPERDVQVKVPVMELITQETTQEEIIGLYHQVYQLKRNLRVVPCSQDMGEEIYLEILEMLKVQLQHRQGPTLPLVSGPLEPLCRQNSMPRCRPHVTATGTCSRSHVRMPW